MQRIPPSTTMREALMTQFTTRGAQGHPLRRFVVRAAELMLQVAIHDMGDPFLRNSRYPLPPESPRRLPVSLPPPAPPPRTRHRSYHAASMSGVTVGS